MALIGAHMSIAGGLHLSIERGDSLGCEAIQIFTQSGRTWATKPVTSEEAALFRNALESAKTVKTVVAHNSYLLNLSTDNEPLRKKSVDYFIANMERCEALGLLGLITHPGSHLGKGPELGIRKTIESLNEILRATKGFKTKIIIENTAGQGGCVGHRFEELSAILNGCRAPERIFFCFDTQHAFAAGYDLRTESGVEEVFEEWDRQISLSKLVAFHLNDSLKEFNSRVDRHHALGEGLLGKAPFQFLLNEKKFANTPMCLETDPGDDMINYRRELALLASMRAVPGRRTKRKH